MMKRWEELGYSDRTIAKLPSGEPMIETPFAMKKDGRIIRGRIDAVYETEEGSLEIVDFKTGRRFEKKDGADQLEIYVEALRRAGVRDEGDISLSYAFVGESEEGEAG
jgi:RecB family exonuclease